jgi:hypothetical protein
VTHELVKIPFLPVTLLYMAIVAEVASPRAPGTGKLLGAVREAMTVFMAQQVAGQTVPMEQVRAAFLTYLCLTTLRNPKDRGMAARPNDAAAVRIMNNCFPMQWWKEHHVTFTFRPSADHPGLYDLLLSFPPPPVLTGPVVEPCEAAPALRDEGASTETSAAVTANARDIMDELIRTTFAGKQKPLAAVLQAFYTCGKDFQLAQTSDAFNTWFDYAYWLSRGVHWGASGHLTFPEVVQGVAVPAVPPPPRLKRRRPSWAPRPRKKAKLAKMAEPAALPVAVAALVGRVDAVVVQLMLTTDPQRVYTLGTGPRLDLNVATAAAASAVQCTLQWSEARATFELVTHALTPTTITSRETGIIHVALGDAPWALRANDELLLNGHVFRFIKL